MKLKIRSAGQIAITSVLLSIAGTACSQQSSASATSSTNNSAAAAPTLSPTGPSTRLTQRSGSRMRIEGTSTAHDWQSESGIIIGYVEVGPNFPLEPGQKVNPGKVEAKGEAKVKVTSLKSKNKD